LNFIGFGDYWGLNSKPENVMKIYDFMKPSIVLCHNHDVCDLFNWNNYEGWILSGQTQSGQVKPPFLIAPFVPTKNKIYTSKKIELSKNRTLYIDRALGHL
jgi:hypothetical protein